MELAHVRWQLSGGRGAEGPEPFPEQVVELDGQAAVKAASACPVQCLHSVGLPVPNAPC